MGQITNATIKMIRDHIARGEHPPITLREIGQLVAAWERGQPAASAEPAVWVAADTLNSPHPKCISSLAYMSQIDQDRGREYVPLAIINHHAAPVAQEPVAYRVMRKSLDGEWKSDGRDWCDGRPSADLVADIAKRSDGWRIEYAYATAPVAAQAQPVAFAKDGVLFWHGEHAAWRGFSGDLYLAAQADVGIPISRTAAPLAAQDREDDEALADTQRAIIEAAERRGYARAEAENVGYRTDAGRYRFIRPGDKDVWCSSGDDLLTGDQLDAAIDAARVAKGADHG